MTYVSDIRGSIPQIVRNDHNLYEGNLVSYFRALFRHADNLNNPYHNFRHVCHVLWLCYKACIFYDCSNGLSKRQMRNLLVAALFHDFDHTGKTGPDSVNIARAIKGLKKYLATEDKEEFEKIEMLIQYTEYPYVIPHDQVTLSGHVLRDADLSQALSVAWIQQVVFGLAKEWGKPPLDVLRAQEVFHGNLKFHTLWAQEMFPRNLIESKISEAKELVEILDEVSCEKS